MQIYTWAHPSWQYYAAYNTALHVYNPATVGKGAVPYLFFVCVDLLFVLLHTPFQVFSVELVALF